MVKFENKFIVIFVSCEKETSGSREKEHILPPLKIKCSVSCLLWFNYILYTCISFDLLSVLVLYCSWIVRASFFFYLDRVMGLFDLCEVSIYLNKHIYSSLKFEDFPIVNMQMEFLL